MNNLLPLHVLLILAAIVYVLLTLAALVATLRDKAVSFSAQVGWTLLLLLAPVIGLPIWAVVWFARRGKNRSAVATSATPAR